MNFAERPPASELPQTYRPGTIEHQMMPKGGRGLDRYEAVFMFDRHELEGMHVLDLGTGPEVKFATELHAAGVPAIVVGLSPDFYDKKQLAKARMHYDGPLVAATGQDMPFEDKFFDRIVALNVHEHLVDDAARIGIIMEMARLLTPRGIAAMGPGYGMWFSNEEAAHSQLEPYLSTHDVTMEEMEIPVEVIPKQKPIPGHPFMYTVNASYLKLTKAEA